MSSPRATVDGTNDRVSNVAKGPSQVTEQCTAVGAAGQDAHPPPLLDPEHKALNRDRDGVGRGSIAIGEQPLIDEARRLYLRYAEELVEDLQLCPWAKAARLAGEVVVDVECAPAPSESQLAKRILALAERPQTAVALLVLPRLQLDAIAFQHLAAAVRRAIDATAWPGRSPWAIADFHPAGPVDIASPERAVALIRRTPDPTLQLVRLRLLQDLRARGGEGTRFVDVDDFDPNAFTDAPAPLHERVAERNYQTVTQLGVQHVLARQAAIAGDRDLTYAKLGLPPAPWAIGKPKSPRQ